MNGFRWISPIPDGRLNSGVKESWLFEGKDQAINDAIQLHTKKPAPAETAVRDWVRRQMKGLGWSITDEKRGLTCCDILLFSYTNYFIV